MAAGMPTSISLEIEFTAGVWTNVWGSCPGGYKLTVGKQERPFEPVPGILEFTLENPSGAYTPDNPLGTYFPNVVEGKRVRVRVVKGSTYTRFVGRLTKIDPQFPDEGLPTVSFEAQDLLGFYQQFRLRPSLEFAILDDSPVAYYPMTEPRDADEVLNAVPTSVLGPLQPFEFGDNGSVTLGEVDGPGVDGAKAPLFDPADTLNGWVLLSDVVPDLGMSGSLSVECWFTTDLVAPAGLGVSETAVALATKKSPNSLIDDYVYISMYTARGVLGRSDQVNAGHRWATGTGNVLSSPGVLPPRPNDKRVHHAVYTESRSGSSVTTKLYFDGAQVDSGSFTIDGTTRTDQTWRMLIVGGLFGQDAWQGSVSNVALYSSALSAAQVLEHYRCGKPSAGDTIDAQIARIGTWTGTTCTSITASGKQAVLPPTDGQSALDALTRIARGETGIAYHDYVSDAVVVVTSPDADPASTSIIVDAERDLLGSPVFGRDATARVARGIASTPVATVTAEDAALLATIGAVEESAECTLAKRPDLHALASSLISRGREQVLRVREATIDLVGAVNDLYANYFALTLGRRVRISNLDTTVMGRTYDEGYLLGYVEEADATTFQATVYLSPADAPRVGRYDTGRYCWGDGVCTLSAGITSSATTLTLTWTGGVTLSTAAGDYPMDIDLNGERVTLNSAPAGGTSPRTFTGVTRGVGSTIARAHSAGEPVEVWDADRFAF
ncbi:MAG: LamG-like jellyroll fold domain-containing protein [Microbacteriaceae bacterium]